MDGGSAAAAALFDSVRRVGDGVVIVVAHHTGKGASSNEARKRLSPLPFLGGQRTSPPVACMASTPRSIARGADARSDDCLLFAHLPTQGLIAGVIMNENGRLLLSKKTPFPPLPGRSDQGVTPSPSSLHRRRRRSGLV